MSTPVPVRLISDFTLDVLGRYLENDSAAPSVAVRVAAFGQPIAALTQPVADESADEIGVVWTRPEAVVEGFARLLAGKPIDLNSVLDEVDAFAAALLAYRQRVRHLLVPTWTLAASRRGYGMLDWRSGLGVANTLARMNLRLAEHLETDASAFLLDATRWMNAAGPRASSPKLWLAAKVPFGNPVFAAAAQDVKAALRGFAGQARKLVVVDLDDTLWGGVVGEVGWEGLVLGGHDPRGEAFITFQHALKGLSRRGIQLAIASKNEEAIALEAIDRHPEMILRREDFAAWRIDWQDKAANVAHLCTEIGLGLEAVVFLDDNPVERARVAEALPAVLVPDWPVDPALYAPTLEALDCFDLPALSAEDRARAPMAAAERARRASRAQVGAVDDWLATLDLSVRVETLDGGNRPRIVQLFNKTNQMNLRTRRLAAHELDAWLADGRRALWAVRVADRFGDAGLTGIVSVETSVSRGTIEIVDFILSCRVIGRRVEETLLHLAVEAARAQNLTRVAATYCPTARNAPCLTFWRRSGFSEEGKHRFVWDAAAPYPLPSCITLHQPAAVDARS